LVLALFITSLIVSILNTFASSESNSSDSIEHHFVATPDAADTSNNLVMCEESENEKNENSIHAIAVLIPYLTTVFQLEVSASDIIRLPSLGRSPHSPIYLSICNFRI
jgi:hypothetical protein